MNQKAPEELWKYMNQDNLKYNSPKSYDNYTTPLTVTTFLMNQMNPHTSQKFTAIEGRLTN